MQATFGAGVGTAPYWLRPVTVPPTSTMPMTWTRWQLAPGWPSAIGAILVYDSHELFLDMIDPAWQEHALP